MGGKEGAVFRKSPLAVVSVGLKYAVCCFQMCNILVPCLQCEKEPRAKLKWFMSYKGKLEHLSCVVYPSVAEVAELAFISFLRSSVSHAKSEFLGAKREQQLHHLLPPFSS